MQFTAAAAAAAAAAAVVATVAAAVSTAAVCAQVVSACHGLIRLVASNSDHPGLGANIRFVLFVYGLVSGDCCM